MTAFLLDLASYQAGVDLTLPAYDAWDIVNIKTSQGDWYVADRVRSRRWADQARAKRKGIMTFHWLDASTSGATQARIAYHEMRELGGPDGMAHQADTEDDGKRYGPLTYRIWADYVDEMQQLMGRHVLNYTGDWWWTAPGRNWWNGAALTPYLMAAPNDGYLAAYPGDRSDHWRAGYGGWDELAAMQYRVGPIGGGGPGADRVSQTAIRDPAVWAALTGGTMDDYGPGLTVVDGHAPNYPYQHAAAAVDVQAVLRTGDQTGWSKTDGGGWFVVRALRTARDAATAARDTASANNGELRTVQVKLDAIKAMVDELQVGGVDLDALAAKVAALIPAPPTAAEVADELARRLGNG